MQPPSPDPKVKTPDPCGATSKQPTQQAEKSAVHAATAQPPSNAAATGPQAGGSKCIDPPPAEGAPAAGGLATTLPDAVSQGARWYLVGFAALGFLVGLFAGLSSSPIVAAILPLLFALLGGTGGLYLGRVDLSGAWVGIKLALLGRALTTFSLIVAVGTAIGIGARLRHDAPSKPADVQIAADNSSDYIELLLLRQKLAMAGASEAEQKKALEMAETDVRTWDAAVPLDKIKLLLARVKVAIDQLVALQTAATTAHEAIPERLPNLVQNLRDFTVSLGAWGQGDLSKGGMPKDRYLAAATRVFYAVTHLTHFHEEEQPWLLAHHFDATPLSEVFEILDEDVNSRGGPTWKSGQPLAKQLDDFLAMTHAGKPSSRDELMPTIDMGETSPDNTAKGEGKDKKNDN